MRFKLMLAFFIILLIGMVIQLSHAENGLWIDEWQKFQQDSSLNPILRNAKVMLPGKEEMIGKLKVYVIQILDIYCRKIGSLTITADEKRIISFQLYYIYEEGNVKPIQVEKAQMIAIQFVHKHYPQIGENPNIEKYPVIDDKGRFTTNFAFFKDDIRIFSVSISVDYAGFVVDVLTGDPIAANNIDLAKMPPSKGRQYVLGEMWSYLRTQKKKYDAIEKLECIIGFGIEDQYCLIWRASAIYLQGSTKMREYVLYDEMDNQCMIERPIPPERYDAQYGTPIPLSCRDSHPVWTHDGNSLWWQTDARWKLLPTWIQVKPFSLGTSSLYIPLDFIYRPLPDIGQLSIDYGLPSPSPDGRWLALKVSNNTLAIIDMPNNRIYVMDEECIFQDRASWSSDSMELINVQSGENYAILHKISSPTGIPFDSPGSHINLGMPCNAIEFIPGEKGILLALLDSKELARVRLRDKGETTIEMVKELPTPIVRMHVLPDGKSAIILDQMGKFAQVDLTSRVVHQLKWLSGKLPDGNDLSGGEHDWDVSPDGTKITFSAKGSNPLIEYIYTASLDGSNVKRITAGDPNEQRQRYRLNKRDAIVSKRGLTLSVLQRFGFLPELDWRTPRLVSSEENK